MKTSLKKITLAVLPFAALLLVTPSSALAKKKHKHHDHDSYSRYDDDCRHGRTRHKHRHDWNRDSGYYDDRSYDDGYYYGRPSRSRSPYTNETPPYYGSPYGNPSSYYPPSSTGALPWLDILLPRY